MVDGPIDVGLLVFLVGIDKHHVQRARICLKKHAAVEDVHGPSRVATDAVGDVQFGPVLVLDRWSSSFTSTVSTVPFGMSPSAQHAVAYPVKVPNSSTRVGAIM